MTAWLYGYVKKHMLELSRLYSSHQIEIGSEAFKGAFVKHRSAVTQCDIVPPQQLLPEQGNDCRPSTLLQKR